MLRSSDWLPARNEKSAPRPSKKKSSQQSLSVPSLPQHPEGPGGRRAAIPGVLLHGFDPGLELFVDLVLLLQLTLRLLPQAVQPLDLLFCFIYLPLQGLHLQAELGRKPSALGNPLWKSVGCWQCPGPSAAAILTRDRCPDKNIVTTGLSWGLNECVTLSKRS